LLCLLLRVLTHLLVRCHDGLQSVLNFRHLSIKQSISQKWSGNSLATWKPFFIALAVSWCLSSLVGESSSAGHWGLSAVQDLPQLTQQCEIWQLPGISTCQQAIWTVMHRGCNSNSSTK
jgi:hypothetical protein